MMRAVKLPTETVLKIDEGSTGYSGIALAMRLAGEDVIIVAPNVAKLNTVFNYTVSHMHAGSEFCKTETLRATLCPQVVVVAKRDTTLDEL